MTWVNVKERKPKHENRIITRSGGYAKDGDSFEDWLKWKKEFSSYTPPITHWWDGKFNFDEAVEAWKNEKDFKEKEES